MWLPQPWVIRFKNGILAPNLAHPRLDVLSIGPWPAGWLRMARLSLLVLVDLAALLISASIAYLSWGYIVAKHPFWIYADFVPLLLLFPLGYAAAGLYPGFGVGAVESVRRFSYCTSLCFLLLAGTCFVLRLPPEVSRMAFAITWASSLATVPLLRFLMLSLFVRFDWWGEPVVLVGRREWLCWVIQSLRSARSLGYRPVGLLVLDAAERIPEIEGVPVLGGPEFSAYVRSVGVRVALAGPEGTPHLSKLQQHFEHVVLIRVFKDLPIERVRICNLGEALGIEFTNNLLVWRNQFVKRVMDLVLGTVCLGLSLPVIAAGALLVKLKSKGPIFFCQEREGLGGRLIRVWKIRTMYPDAEHRLHKLLETDPELQRQWREHFKLAEDPRIIEGVGHCLRRFSVDELPQIWNVIKGEMSLVGPRPFPDYHLREFTGTFREFRQRVRPGLTGMWQVMVRSAGTVDDQQAYDTYYIRNWSIWLDLYILARTCLAVLQGRGAS